MTSRVLSCLNTRRAVCVFRWALIFLVVAPMVPAVGKAPVLRALAPRGAQQGKAFMLTLKGQGLTPSAEVITSLHGSFSRLATSRKAQLPETELVFLVQLTGDTPLGLYPFRVRTDEGLSNVLLFSVGSFPEVFEAESLLDELPESEFERYSNDSMDTAQKVTPPVTINGTLRGPDRDYYRFDAKGGERLVFEVEARRVGSAIDPVIQVVDKYGRELASNDDAPGLGVDSRVEVLFPRTDWYYIMVHDVKFSEQKENFYRLLIGSYSYAEGIFPLGWQRGRKVGVVLSGGNLRKPVTVKPDLSAPPSQGLVPISLPGGAGLPFLFRVGDLPEIIEPAETEDGAGKTVSSSPATLPPSTVVNGRIGRPGEVDRYRLRVSPGEQWVIQLEAADLGTSQLAGLLSVVETGSNKTLARAGMGEPGHNDGSSPYIHNEVDPHLSFRVPEKVEEVIVSVEDMLGRGGLSYGYRLSARRQTLDFSLMVLTPFVNIPPNGTAVVEVGVNRRGYKGAIRVKIPDLPDDIEVIGGNLPAQPVPQMGVIPAYLTLSAKPATRPRALELSIWGEAVSAETSFSTQASVPGLITRIEGTEELPFTAPWMSTTLSAAIVKPLPVSLEVPQRHFRLRQGTEIKIPWKVLKDTETQFPIKVRLRDAQSCCGVTFLTDLVAVSVPNGAQQSEQGVLHVTAGLNTPAVTFDFVLDAVIDDKEQGEQTVSSPALTIEVVPLYTLKFASKTVEITRGGNVELRGTVEREPGFRGTIKVGAEGLPEHANSSEAAIAANENEFCLVFQAGPEVKPGIYDFRVVSTSLIAEKGNQIYRGPDSRVRLKVSPK